MDSARPRRLAIPLAIAILGDKVTSLYLPLHPSGAIQGFRETGPAFCLCERESGLRPNPVPSHTSRDSFQDDQTGNPAPSLVFTY